MNTTLVGGPCVALDPEMATTMALVVRQVCDALGVQQFDKRERETVAIRVLHLARAGEYDPDKLRDQVLREANGRTDA